GTVGATTDNGDGTYTAALTAAAGVTGTANITVKVGGNTFGSLKTTVALTALPPLPAKSTLGRDKDTILADGTDKSTLTLTLNDALNQKVKGQTVVFVTDRGTVGATTDNGDGTYTAALTAAAGVTGTANITVKVGGNTFGSLKTTVEVKTATPDMAKSGIKLDNTAYVAGTDMGVTVTLHDALDVGVAGAADSLATAVAVPGAVMKAGTHWTDAGSGTYTATYTATTVVSGQKAGLKLSGWTGTAESATYGISAAPADASKSTLHITSGSGIYHIGNIIKLKMILKDTNDNAVTGVSSQLDSATVNLPGTEKQTGNWSETSTGVYEMSYKAISITVSSKAEVKLVNWRSSVSSTEQYSVKLWSVTGKVVAPENAHSLYAGDSVVVSQKLTYDSDGSPVTGAADSVKFKLSTEGSNISCEAEGVRVSFDLSPVVEGPPGTYSSTVTLNSTSLEVGKGCWLYGSFYNEGSTWEGSIVNINLVAEK
ncbi:Ig-like domain-containing protein, partial [Enterobacter bugandensis]|uniref:Ig-like domain-containing protein n=1 Tax=Enterobacter bugandensis TaxID=881260 RepID=UPI002002F8AC